MEVPKAPPRIIKLEHARKENLSFLVNPKREQTCEEFISLEAGRLAGRLYSSLLQRYHKEITSDLLQSLNIFCVMIVFLLYAEDFGIFPKAQFHDYLKAHTNTARTSLLELFRVLSTSEEKRDSYLEDDLAAFQYINGGLFGGTEIELPKLDDEPVNIILAEMSEGFDWSEITPTIFGALFESTLNPETLRTGRADVSRPCMWFGELFDRDVFIIAPPREQSHRGAFTRSEIFCSRRVIAQSRSISHRSTE